MAQKQISTTISQEYHELAKANNIKWHDALSRGIQVLANRENLNAEIELMKENIQRLQGRLTSFGTRIFELEKENEELKNSIEQKETEELKNSIEQMEMEHKEQ